MSTHRATPHARLQLVVPYYLRKQTQQELHAGAVVRRNTVESREVFLPHMHQDVQEWCRTCAYPKDVSHQELRPSAEHQEWVPHAKLQMGSADILGPLQESEAGNSYVLVAGDSVTVARK